MRLLMLNNEFPPFGGGTGTVNQAMLQHFVRVPGLEPVVAGMGWHRAPYHGNRARTKVLALAIAWQRDGDDILRRLVLLGDLLDAQLRRDAAVAVLHSH